MALASSIAAVVSCSWTIISMYKLRILEQPEHVRTSGYVTTVSGRPINPVPVLQLSYITGDDSSESASPRPSLELQDHQGDRSEYQQRMPTPEHSSQLNQPRNTSRPTSNALNPAPLDPSPHDPTALEGPPSSVAETNSDEQSRGNRSRDRNATRAITTLFGSLVSPSYFARGLDQAMGVFFVFGNLCVRMEGSFRLQFTLVDLHLYLPASAASRPISQYVRAVV
ncbi:velvet factor [Polychytrium aggregatum]|uniref:velvet factor n=1 Tax=Polychytrium aggregatum TaxID=110093 RepID=UPI0022FEC837|nr:velvet factor [Polychytrium aggregatum]KAI9205183.1 velvet factor [Polychytrium aggregatum]